MLKKLKPERRDRTALPGPQRAVGNGLFRSYSKNRDKRVWVRNPWVPRFQRVSDKQYTGAAAPEPNRDLSPPHPYICSEQMYIKDFRTTFSSLEETLEWRLDAELVFLKEKQDHSRKRTGPQRE